MLTGIAYPLVLVGVAHLPGLAAKADGSIVHRDTRAVGSRLIGSDAFQETDITGITLPITKHNYLVTSAAEVAASVREAFAVARSGRPGPVLVDVVVHHPGGGGGRILGHYLPAVASGDSPQSLFDKTVVGAPQMYARLIAFLQENTK